MKCIDCRFLSDRELIGTTEFASVHCTLGAWDKDNKAGAPQYYSWGSAVRNRSPIKKHGESCARGMPKLKGG